MKIRIYDRLPIEFFGGGEVSVVQLANHLGAEGYEVEVVSDSSYHGPTRLEPNKVSPLVHHFRYVREDFAPPAFPYLHPFFRTSPRPEKMHSDDVHLVVVDRPPPLPFFTQLARRGIGKVALLMYGFSFESIRGTNPAIAGFQIFNNSYFRYIAGGINRSRIAIQVLTDESAASFARLGVPRDRLFVIPSGLPTGHYPDPRVGDRFAVVYVGRLDVVMKGCDLLERLALAIERDSEPTLSLSILGSGPASTRFSRFKRGARVTYHGFVDEGEKLRILQHSDLLVSTSYMEPFSLSVVEGLLCGLPVVSTSTNGPRSIVGRNPDFGKLVERSADAFMKAIRQYLTSWSHRRDTFLQQKRERQRLAALTFDEAQMFEGYERLVEYLAGRGA